MFLFHMKKKILQMHTSDNLTKDLCLSAWTCKKSLHGLWFPAWDTMWFTVSQHRCMLARNTIRQWEPFIDILQTSLIAWQSLNVVLPLSWWSLHSPVRIFSLDPYPIAASFCGPRQWSDGLSESLSLLTSPSSKAGLSSQQQSLCISNLNIKHLGTPAMSEYFMCFNLPVSKFY